MYRLIVSDVDGTLVPEGTSDLNPRLIDFILKLKKQGIRFAAASGRQYDSIRYAFREIYNDIFFVADNGAYIYEQDRMLVCNTFPREDFTEFVRYLRTIPNLLLMVSSREGSFTDRYNAEFLAMLQDNYGLGLKPVPDLTALDLHASKIGVYCLDGNPRELAQGSRERFADALNIFVSGANWMDYIPRGVDKGAGVAWIQQHLGISPEETIAFGDQNNDISMLKNASESYAVREAGADVKEAARHVMEEGPEEDGVLHVLQKLFPDV